MCCPRVLAWTLCVVVSFATTTPAGRLGLWGAERGWIVVLTCFNLSAKQIKRDILCHVDHIVSFVPRLNPTVAAPLHFSNWEKTGKVSNWLVGLHVFVCVCMLRYVTQVIMYANSIKFMHTFTCLPEYWQVEAGSSCDRRDRRDPFFCVVFLLEQWICRYKGLLDLRRQDRRHALEVLCLMTSGPSFTMAT